MFSYVKKSVIFIFLTISLFANSNFFDPTTVTGNQVPDLSHGGSATLPQLANSLTGQYVYAVWERTVIQVARSTDYGNNWVDPTSTPGGTPNLSDGGQTAQRSQITTNSTGQYVYAIWLRNNGSNDIVEVALSSDYGDNWVDPSSTPEGTPKLSAAGENANSPQITTASSTGQYVYAIWTRGGKGVTNVQAAISTDYGNNWVDPSSTPVGAGTPNLTNAGEARNPQIATSSTGQYVYAIWERYDGSHYIIEVAISTDYGDNWVDPTSTTGSGGTPALSDAGQNADIPQITTSSTGQYVYATWRRNDGSNYITQVAISTDYGDNWVDPTTVTGDHAGCLSEDGKSSFNPQITTSSPGQYVYVIWARSEEDNVIETAISADYGDNWVYPTSSPGGTHGGIPYLSRLGGDAAYPQIATSSTGQYVYVIWYKNDGSDLVAQVTISSDNGVNWVDPAIVTGSQIPDLSRSGGDVLWPQITTDSSGKYVYGVWERDDIIQEVNGINTDAGTPLQASGLQTQVRFPFQIDIINTLVWGNLSEAVTYRIYSDADLTNLITELFPKQFNEFIEHQIKKDEIKTYYIVYTDSHNFEYGLATVILP